MKILVIYLFGLLLASPTLALPSFLETLGDLYHDAVPTGTEIADKISTWINSHISREQPDADPLIIKINQTLLKYANTLKGMEKDKHKLYETFKRNIRNGFYNCVQNISDLSDFLEEKDPNNECMDDILLRLVNLELVVLDKVKDCQTTGTTEGYNIMESLNKAQEILTKKARIPVKYLEKCNKNTTLPKIPQCNERVIRLFSEDMNDIISDLQAEHSKTAVQLFHTGADTQVCMRNAIYSAKGSTMILQYSGCS